MELVADLAAPTPGLEALTALPEVSGLRWSTPVRLELSLTGPPGVVLRALAEVDVVRLEVREPSLEEIFLDYYGQVPA
jgi:ABC-2 type transport system ATP-binding protein